MTTDFRALCAKVLAYNEGKGDYDFHHLNSYDRDNAAFDAWQEIKTELKCALAEPQPEPPTKAELKQVFDDHSGYINDEQVMWWSDFHAAARAVLARWGNS